MKWEAIQQGEPKVWLKHQPAQPEVYDGKIIRVGKAESSYYLKTLVKPRGNVLWYVAAIFILPGMIALAIILSQLLGIEIPPPMNPADSWRDFVAAVVLSSGYGFFFGNAVGEEVGWRGFALPRLQARYSPLVASLILAFPWFIWHFPLPQAQGFMSNLELHSQQSDYYLAFQSHGREHFSGWSLPCVL